jgi:hypothetical protein
VFVRNAGHIKVKKLLKNKYVKNKDSVNAGSFFLWKKPVSRLEKAKGEKNLLKKKN